MDRQVADKIIENLKENKVNVVDSSLPYSIEEVSGKYKVQWKNQKTYKESEGEFDTILAAIGRSGNTSKLNLKNVGVELNPEN